MHYLFLWLFFNLNVLIALPKATLAITTTLSSLISSNDKPLITQILVFSTNSETVISFEPKTRWILGEEKKFLLYISGSNLKNNSLVFTSSSNQCPSSDFVSPIYRLSSAPIIKLNVKLKGLTKSHSSIHLCLLPSLRSKINQTRSRNGTVVEGSYFTFIREKSRLPFAAKICLILMLFTVSGFFR
jgi:hypothetical protein